MSEKEIIRRKIISEETKNKITELYETKEVTAKQTLVDMFGMTKKRVCEILVEKGVGTINAWDRTKINPVIDGDKYIPTEEYTFVARHKETGREITDFNNVSGKLTTYLRELNPDIKIDTLALRATYFKKTGSYWYEEFYDIIKIPIIVKKMKGELYPEDITEIIRLYSTGEFTSIATLGGMFKVGNKKIASILKDNNIPIRATGGQFKEVKKPKIEFKVPVKYDDDDIYTYKAVCMLDGIEFTDYKNSNGTLMVYLRDNYPNINILSDKKKKTYFKQTGNYWYEPYFNIIKIEKPEKEPMRKCDYCDWEMPLDVSTRQYKMHLTMKHNITIKEHLELYPRDNDLFKDDFDKIEEEKVEDNWVVCEVCGDKFKHISANHLAKHGMTTYQYRIKYGTTMSKNYFDGASTRMTDMNVAGKMYSVSSNGEKEVGDFVNGLGINFISDRTILNGKEIDVLIEEKKLGIEFNGCKWHSEWFGGRPYNFHLNKTLLANEKGYSLIHIFEDEWALKQEIVKNKLKHLLGVNENKPKIAGRKTIIKKIGKGLTIPFLNEFHIQGEDNHTTALGAFYGDILIGVMTFKVLKKGGLEYDLTRFSTNYNYICQGVGSKLLNHFIKEYKPTSIISFADRRWTLNKVNNVYTKMGFELVDELRPDYKYYNENVDRYTRFHKFGFRKQILSKKYNLPIEMTETDMVKYLGYDRVWDCGLLKYRLEVK